MIRCHHGLLFQHFEVSDEFPKGADVNGDENVVESFIELGGVFPSCLPADELALLRDSLHRSLCQTGRGLPPWSADRELKHGIYDERQCARLNWALCSGQGKALSLVDRGGPPTTRHRSLRCLEAYVWHRLLGRWIALWSPRQAACQTAFAYISARAAVLVRDNIHSNWKGWDFRLYRQRQIFSSTTQRPNPLRA